MSQRAWVTLIGLVLISLLVAGAVIWLVQSAVGPQAGPIFGPQWGHPGFGPRPPWEEDHRFSGWQRPFWSAASPWWLLGRVLASEVFFFLAGALVFILFPARLQRLQHALSRRGNGHPWALLGIGVLTAVLLLALGILAVFSFVGLPFLPWLFLLVAFAWTVGLVAVALWVGCGVRNIARLPDRQPLLDLALGVVTLFIVGSVPVLGWLALLLAGLWGVGAVAATRFGSAEGWQLNALIETE